MTPLSLCWSESAWIMGSSLCWMGEGRGGTCSDLIIPHRFVRCFLFVRERCLPRRPNDRISAWNRSLNFFVFFAQHNQTPLLLTEAIRWSWWWLIAREPPNDADRQHVSLCKHTSRAQCADQFMIAAFLPSPASGRYSIISRSVRLRREWVYLSGCIGDVKQKKRTWAIRGRLSLFCKRYGHLPDHTYPVTEHNMYRFVN